MLGAEVHALVLDEDAGSTPRPRTIQPAQHATVRGAPDPAARQQGGDGHEGSGEEAEGKQAKEQARVEARRKAVARAERRRSALVKETMKKMQDKARRAEEHRLRLVELKRQRARQMSLFGFIPPDDAQATPEGGDKGGEAAAKPAGKTKAGGEHEGGGGKKGKGGLRKRRKKRATTKPSIPDSSSLLRPTQSSQLLATMTLERKPIPNTSAVNASAKARRGGAGKAHAMPRWNPEQNILEGMQRTKDLTTRIRAKQQLQTDKNKAAAAAAATASAAAATTTTTTSAAAVGVGGRRVSAGFGKGKTGRGSKAGKGGKTRVSRVPRTRSDSPVDLDGEGEGILAGVGFHPPYHHHTMYGEPASYAEVETLMDTVALLDNAKESVQARLQQTNSRAGMSFSSTASDELAASQVHLLATNPSAGNSLYLGEEDEDVESAALLRHLSSVRRSVQELQTSMDLHRMAGNTSASSLDDLDRAVYQRHAYNGREDFGDEGGAEAGRLGGAGVGENDFGEEYSMSMITSRLDRITSQLRQGATEARHEE